MSDQVIIRVVHNYNTISVHPRQFWKGGPPCPPFLSLISALPFFIPEIAPFSIFSAAQPALLNKIPHRSFLQYLQRQSFPIFASPKFSVLGLPEFSGIWIARVFRYLDRRSFSVFGSSEFFDIWIAGVFRYLDRRSLPIFGSPEFSFIILLIRIFHYNYW